MSPMAASHVRVLFVAIGLALLATACSGGDDSGLPTLEEAAETSTTTTPADTTTTTTAPATTTTLSDLQQAEAEVERVVVEWYTFPADTSQEGNAEEFISYLTGLQRQRVIEWYDGLERDGLIRRVFQEPPMKVTDIAVDLVEGSARVDVCDGSADEIVDAATLEVLETGDPDQTFAGHYQLLLVEGEWKISNVLSTQFSEDPAACEVAS